MAYFEDLPVELLPLIVVHLLKPGHLSSLCLVSRTFHLASVPELYKRIAIFPWHKSSKSRVTKLFRTLAECPNLARLVHQLEIRDFPKRYGFVFFEEPMGWCIKGLENCVRLKVCTWTRDGSLTSAVLKSLGGCPELTDITVNGDHSWHYEPMDLVQLLGLRKISLIMPSMSVLGILPIWLQGTGQSLISLTLVCKEDIHVTDSLLVSMSQYLPRLNQLHLVGCPRVTNEGVWSMIRNNIRNIQDLSLENLSPAFDMLALGEACMRAGGLVSLRSFTLTASHENSSDIRMDGTELLLRESPLEVFQIYVPNSDSEVTLADAFCVRVIDRHRDHLVRFSFHRQCINLDVIGRVCTSCPRLEELFTVIHHAEIALLVPILAKVPHLRTVHIHLVGQPPIFDHFMQAMDVVRQCSPTISQVGIDTVVWKVERCVSIVDGIVQLGRFLTEDHHPDIPERLLVVRT